MSWARGVQEFGVVGAEILALLWVTGIHPCLGISRFNLAGLNHPWARCLGVNALGQSRSGGGRFFPLTPSSGSRSRSLGRWQLPLCRCSSRATISFNSLLFRAFPGSVPRAGLVGAPGGGRRWLRGALVVTSLPPCARTGTRRRRWPGRWRCPETAADVTGTPGMQREGGAGRIPRDLGIRREQPHLAPAAPGAASHPNLQWQGRVGALSSGKKTFPGKSGSLKTELFKLLFIVFVFQP